MNRINRQYLEAIRQDKEKRKSITRNIFYISLLLVFATFMIDMILNTQATFVIMLVFCGISTLALITMLLLPLYTSEKPMYEVLISEIIKDINLNRQRNIDYQAFPKEKELFNRSGLYPKSTSKLNRFQMMLSTDYHTNINVFFTELFTQTDKSRVVYLKGLYLKFDTMNDQLFQIRSKGNEKHKGIKLKKEILEDKTRIFTEDLPVNETYLSLYKKLKDRYKQVEISGIDRQIHVSINHFFDFKKPKEISQEVYQSFYDKMIETIELIDEISEDISY
ncbi:hypothetical protein KHQ88_01290 [Mycoplasmatota bacterium]|nr:hypothetical protein KHQ88_01290 [Mycoplasmatota bacterium]